MRSVGWVVGLRVGELVFVAMEEVIVSFVQKEIGMVIERHTLGLEGCSKEIIVSSSCACWSRGMLEVKIWESEWRSMRGSFCCRSLCK